MVTPSCPVPDSNQDPCHDGGREHRPGGEVEDDNDEDEDAEDEEDKEDEDDKDDWDEDDWGPLPW